MSLRKKFSFLFLSIFYLLILKGSTFLLQSYAFLSKVARKLLNFFEGEKNEMKKVHPWLTDDGRQGCTSLYNMFFRVANQGVI